MQDHSSVTLKRKISPEIEGQKEKKSNKRQNTEQTQTLYIPMYARLGDFMTRAFLATKIEVPINTPNNSPADPA